VLKKGSKNTPKMIKNDPKNTPYFRHFPPILGWRGYPKYLYLDPPKKGPKWSKKGPKTSKKGVKNPH
jgi:hypothetical protein